MIFYENLAKLHQCFEDELQEAFSQVLKKGWYIQGDFVNQFEADFAKYCGTKHCIGVSNGLDALKLALLALDLPKKSEIIVPAHTFIATLLSVIHAGHIPVPVEPDPNTYTIDPAAIEEKITPNTKAIVVVHLYGAMADMDAITTLVEKHELFLLEDASQAHGACFKGKKAGSYGTLSAFSFYPVKNLGALGDAGAVLSSDEKYAQKVRLLGNYGSSQKYIHELAGYNNRLDELQAAFLSVKLRHLDRINAHKQKLAQIYLNHLHKNFICPQFHPDTESVFHIFPIRHPERDRLRQYLNDNHIQTGIHYPIPPHQQKALQTYLAKQSYPICEEIHKTILSLPISFIHREEEIYQVVEVLNNF